MRHSHARPTGSPGTSVAAIRGTRRPPNVVTFLVIGVIGDATPEPAAFPLFPSARRRARDPPLVRVAFPVSSTPALSTRTKWWYVEVPSDDGSSLLASDSTASSDGRARGRSQTDTTRTTGCASTFEGRVETDARDEEDVHVTAPLLNDLSGFQRDLLYTVPGLERPSGRAVGEEAERLFEREVSHGLLYPNLNELVEAELLVKGHLDRRTNYYELTPLGRKLAERRSRWECERLGLQMNESDTR